MPEGKEEELVSDILALKFSWYCWWGAALAQGVWRDLVAWAV